MIKKILHLNSRMILKAINATILPRILSNNPFNSQNFTEIHAQVTLCFDEITSEKYALFSWFFSSIFIYSSKQSSLQQRVTILGTIKNPYFGHIQMILEKAYNPQNSHLLQTFLSSEQAQTVQSQLYILNTVENRELQQHCLEKLRSQRAKIEELVRINERLEQQLCAATEEKKKLSERVQQLECGLPYQQFYEDLKQEYQSLAGTHEVAQLQIEELKRELEQAVTSLQQENDNLKGRLRREREVTAVSISHLEALIADRDEQLRRVKQQGKTVQSSLRQQLAIVCEEKEALRESLQQRGCELEQNKSLLKQEIQTRSIDIADYQRTIEHMKKQVNCLKLELSSASFEREREREEYLELIEQRRSALRLIKKEREDKQSQNNDLKEAVKHYEHKNQSLEESIKAFKANISKMKHQSEATLAKITQNTEQEISKLQTTVARLKKQAQKHVQDYNLLSIEHKRVKRQLEQREDHEKQRKTRILSELHSTLKLDRSSSRHK